MSAKTKSQNKTNKTKRTEAAVEGPEVLTLAEAAEYLRVSEEDMNELATRGELHGRNVRGEWRFHRQALARWLCVPSPRERLLRHAGVAKDDPYLDQILEDIYRDRKSSLDGDEE